MLAYFIIGLSVLVALLVGGRSLANADPKKLARALKLSAAIILGLLAGFFILTGRFAFAPPLAILALMFLRNRPFFGGGSRPSSGQTSNVETSWLQATLNHDSGEMDGKVLRGDFEGYTLSSMTLEQLLQFREEAAEDEQTINILNTFLDRYFSEEADEEATTGQSSKEERTRARSRGGPMSRAEALEILELDNSATKDDIKSAHRQLMKKFHPDHDGSDYMAAKLNEAKDLLLKTK
ncbi:MAG: DnaJ domain-containing protein [Proteobacteria bacterium]|nr:DnaJ domain-containing protein [Pseudomonadota bacterium]